MIYPVSRKNRYLRGFLTRRVFIPGKDVGESVLLYPQILKSPNPPLSIYLSISPAQRIPRSEKEERG
jgi:hypothetical protein